MEFKMFKERLTKHFKEMTQENERLFVTDIDKDSLWNIYLDSFPEGTNKIFRKRREYDCSCCRHFIKVIGNVVKINGDKIETIWDFETGSNTFNVVSKAMSEYVKSKAISNLFISKFDKIGTNKNYERTDKEIIEWEHLCLEIPNYLVNTSVSKSIDEIRGDYKINKQVFEQSLKDIDLESLNIVLELISQNSLYKGQEWKSALKEFRKLKKEYDSLNSENSKELFLWKKSGEVGITISRIKNHSIGTLLINLSEGMDLETAVKKYEVIVAPANYKRPKALFTQKMLEEAQKTVTELGYLNSLGRRFATLEDITVNNILFLNKDSAKKIVNEDIFSQMSKEVTINVKKFNRVQEIGIEDFIKNVLPEINELEVFVENKHTNNLMSLIAPKDKDSKTMFKWNNNFSWAYKGNMTDTNIRDNVKNAGGNVDGVLRFSIQWNDLEEYNGDDLDAHCIEPSGNHIYYNNRVNKKTTGTLDIDIRQPKPKTPAVENITWVNINKMKEGTYKFYVNNFRNNGGKDGFIAEISLNGEVYTFEYRKPIGEGKNIDVAEVTLKNGEFTIKELLPSSMSSKKVWNINTQQFVPISVMMYSPNYWDSQKGVGNKHYFFMLKDCINEENPNGFYNEFLDNDLNKHRKVFEALGSKVAVEDCDNQLSGLGFSSTINNELLVKVKGNTERILKIKF